MIDKDKEADLIIDRLKHTKQEIYNREMNIIMTQCIREEIDADILKALNKQYDEERWHKENPGY
jgi:hypothetical protein